MNYCLIKTSFPVQFSVSKFITGYDIKDGGEAQMVTKIDILKPCNVRSLVLGKREVKKQLKHSAGLGGTKS